MKKETLKVTLASGKVIVLRRLQIRHLQMAEKAAGSMQGMAFVNEILKQLIIKIDEKMLKAVDLEDLDALLDIGDYMALQGVVGKFVEQSGEPKIEVVFGEP